MQEVGSIRWDCLVGMGQSPNLVRVRRSSFELSALFLRAAGK